MNSIRARELADWLGGELEGDGDRQITGVAAIEAAGPHELAFAAGRKAAELARASAAGCLLVSRDFPAAEGRCLIRVADPRGAFARAVRWFYPEREPEPGIHPTAVISPAAVLGERVAIGPLAVVCDGARVGDGTLISAGCYLGRDSAVGERCTLHPNVTIYERVTIGDRVIIHSGAVIGADGFGFVLAGDRYEKFPQVGRVEIGNDVEIGANCCIDRAALGVTSIGDGAKLDNMVHVAHNCRIGKHVVVAAQTGFSGGVVVGDYAVIGGQVGIGDKARIESRAVLGSGCGVLTSKVIRSGQVVWGTPARPLKEYLEMLANLSRLPRLREEVAELRRRLEALEERQ
jgi:UDP-3-O-[3-hydroxymyristoyl] glucosamine N-acyltransferase